LRTIWLGSKVIQQYNLKDLQGKLQISRVFADHLPGTLFSKPMQAETARPNGTDAWVAGLVGTQAECFLQLFLSFQVL